MGSKVTLGSDPEFVLTDLTGKVKSADGLIKGNKGQASAAGSGDFGVLADGVMLELNDFVPFQGNNPMGYFRHWGERFRDFHSTFLSPMGLTVRRDPVAEYPAEALTTPGVLEIGCSPDIDAYGEIGTMRPSFHPMEFGNFRFAGGHVHIGLDPWPDFITKRQFIRLLDLALGVQVRNVFPEANRRTPFYGMPGLYRDKPYGVEYRSLDNRIFLLAATGAYHKMEWNYLFGPMHAVISIISTDDYLPQRKTLTQIYNSVNWYRVQSALINGNKESVEYCNRLNSQICAEMGFGFSSMSGFAEDAQTWVATAPYRADVTGSKLAASLVSRARKSRISDMLYQVSPELPAAGGE